MSSTKPITAPGCTLGIDIGSTTVKVAILGPQGELLFSDYKRHYANIQETLSSLIQDAAGLLGDLKVSPVITGSGGLTLANHLEIHRRLSTIFRRRTSRSSSAARTPRSSISRAATSNSA